MTTEAQGSIPVRGVAVIVCVLVGCGTTDIDRDVCGNGIVEAGEDCDSTDPRCESCGVTCTATSECLAYDPDGMVGFVCGPDNVCHAPGGRFQSGAGFAMPAESYRVTDVNKDGLGDVLVQSQTSVTAVYDAATFATTRATLQTPIARGNAAFALVDDDDSLDTLLPTTDGIVAFTARFDVPSPYPFPSPIAPTMGSPLFVHPITPPAGGPAIHLGLVSTLPPDGRLAYIVMDVSQQPPAFIGQKDLCSGKAADLDTSEIEVFEKQPQHEVVAMTLRPQGVPARTCIVTADIVGATYDVRVVTFTPTAEPLSRPVLGDLRGQPCPSIVLAQGAGQVAEYAPNVGSPCTFESAPRFVVGVPAGAVPIGTVPLVPSVGGRNLALALSTGIYDAIVGAVVTVAEVYHSDRVLHRVRAADLDGDLDTDIVASGKNAEDLDILDRKLPSGFLRFRFDTAAPVTQFLLGDFDGNELPDIAYVERDLEEQRLQIAYGTTDQFLAGVNVGTFTRILSVIPASIPDSTDPAGLIDDLAVLFEEPVMTGSETFVPAISLLHGSPQRTMLAFFDPRAPPPAPQSQFRGVVAGFFSGSGSNGNDVVAIEQAGTITRLYLSIGATNGELQMTDSNDASNVTDCKSDAAADPNGNVLCIDDAHFLAWSLGDSHDLVVAIDSKLDVAAFDPRTLGGGAPITMTRWSNTIMAPAGSVARKVQRVVLGESSPRLLISLGPSLEAPDPRKAGAVSLCTFDEIVGPVCEDLSTHVSAAFGPQICVDGGVTRVAAASRFHPPDSVSPDLVLLCHDLGGSGDALYRMSFDGDVIRSVDLIDFVRADAIQIGDVSGDGIDDIIALDRQQVIPVMTVYRQCNSRDTACGLAAVVGEGDRP